MICRKNELLGTSLLTLRWLACRRMERTELALGVFAVYLNLAFNRTIVRGVGDVTISSG